MKADTLIDDSSPGQELRYVTAHFRDLQGLRMAPFWASMLVLTRFAHYVSSGHLALAAVILGGLEFGWLHVSGRWYERRYGVVIQPEPPTPSGLISIMHPETRPKPASTPYYGWLSGTFTVLSLLWAFGMLPIIFWGRHSACGQFALMTALYQVFPRCIYPVTSDWSVILRRVLAVTASIAIAGIYIGYCFAQIGIWNWMGALFGIFLSLDLYDHWLFNHLLARDPTEESHE